MYHLFQVMKARVTDAKQTALEKKVLVTTSLIHCEPCHVARKCFKCH